MRGRHAAMLGFGVGALTVLGVAAAAGTGMLQTRTQPASNSAAASPSPAPTPSAAAVAGLPGPRAGATLVYDPENKGVILFGGTYTVPHADGTNEGVSTGDTWPWNGTDWNLQNPATSPTVRHFASMAYDPVHDDTVLFGGSMPGVRLNDTWTWDGTTWTKQAAVAPAASGWSYVTYDPAAKAI